jgi:hypothetical protein
MKKIFLLMFYAAVSFYSVGQDNTIVFNSIEHDFGLIKEDNGPVEYSFPFINQGIDTIRIKGVRASCGCTTSGWSKDAILPGDTGFVKAQYNPLNRPGMFHKTITVSTNAKPAVTVLHIKGSVMPKPRSLAEEFPSKNGGIRMKFQSFHMGKMITRSPVKRSFDWVNISDKNVAFDSIQAPPYLQISFSPSMLKPKEKGAIEVIYDPVARNDFGFVVDSIKIFSSDSLNPVKDIRVVASIVEYFPPMSEKELKKAPRIEFLETNHDFGHVVKGKKIKSSFKFANTGKNELAIRKVETNCQCVSLDTIPPVVGAGDEFTINSTFDTSGRYGTQQKTITIFSNDPTNPINVLTIKGRILNEQ